MKVALISTESLVTHPKKYGGVESMVYNLCKYLTEKGIDVTLFGCNGSSSPSGKLVEVIEEGWGKSGQSEKFEKKIIGMKNELKKFDIVHDNSHNKPCRKIHKRVLNTIHWGPIGKSNYKNVVAVSEKLADLIRPNIHGKVKVVHHGYDLSKYIFKREKSNRFLFISIMPPIDGADVVLSTAKAMNLEIDFAGLGGSTSGMVGQESRINFNIHYFEEVTEDEKLSLYQNAKALIFPTGIYGNYEEPFWLVAVEAMSCGTPVIAWNSGAMSEIVLHGETGFLCNNMEDLQNAIRNTDNISPERCRDHIEENFTYQAMAKKYIRLYEKLLNGHTW